LRSSRLIEKWVEQIALIAAKYTIQIPNFSHLSEVGDLSLRRFLEKNIPPKIPDFSEKVGDLPEVSGQILLGKSPKQLDDV
jgi:hypothetical protein